MKKTLLLVLLTVIGQFATSQTDFIATTKTTLQLTPEMDKPILIGNEAQLSYFIFNNQNATLEHLTPERRSLYYLLFQETDIENRVSYRVAPQDSNSVKKVQYSEVDNQLELTYDDNGKTYILLYPLKNPQHIDRELFIHTSGLIIQQTDLIRKNKNLLESLYLRAIYYYLLTDNTRSMQDIKKAITLGKSENSENIHKLYELQGDVYSAMNEPTNAINSFSQSIKHAKNQNYYPFFQRGKALIKTKHWEEAIGDLLLAKKIVPSELVQDRHQIKMLLGRTYRSLDSTDKAINCFDEAISLVPDDYLAYSYRGNLFAKKMSQDIPGYAEKVIKDYTIYLQNATPNTSLKAHILGERGQAYMEKGVYNLAIEDFSECLELSPNGYTYALRGDAKRLSGDYENAITDFSSALKLSPDFAWAYYRRGWTKEFIKEYNGALDDYNKAIEKDPQYAYTYLSRGTLLFHHYCAEEAIPDFNKVLELETTPLSNGNSRPFALALLGREEEAITWMLKVVKEFPTYGNYYDLACLYAKTIQPKKALEALKMAIDKGYSDYVHMKNDPGLTSLREAKIFIKIVNDLKAKIAPPMVL